MKTNIIIATMAACMLLHDSPLMGQGFSLSNHFRNNDKIEASKKTTTYELENPARFERIKLAGSGTVEYRQSTDGQTRVTVTVAENVLDYLEVEVREGILCNRWKAINTSITGAPKLKIVCESPMIDAIEVNGSGKFCLPEAFNGRRLAMVVAGSGEIEVPNLNCEEVIQADVAGSGTINVNGSAKYCLIRIADSGEVKGQITSDEQLSAKISGSGEIHLAGSATKANYDITGSGEIHADNMKAQDVNARVTGSGIIDCQVTHALETKVTGSGKINYSGNPSTINSNNVRKSSRKQVDTEEVMEGL